MTRNTRKEDHETDGFVEAFARIRAIRVIRGQKNTWMQTKEPLILAYLR